MSDKCLVIPILTTDQTLEREFPDKPSDLIDEIRNRSREADARFQRLLATATSSPIVEERSLADTVLRTTFGLDSFLLEGQMAG